MFVKSLESPDEYVATLQDASHPVVSVLQHLAALVHSHGGGSDDLDSHWICLLRGLSAGQPNLFVLMF
jgi:hypothetical protein